MKKSKLLIAPLLVIPLLANCGSSTEYKVDIPDISGVSVHPGQVTKGKDYVGTIEIATDVIDKQILPDKLDKVTSGNKELQPTDYTYTLKEDKLSADFNIPAENIVGDIQIDLSLVNKAWFDYQDWWNYCSNGVDGVQATEDDIGQEVKVTLNVEGGEVEHTVRLIGVDHKGTPNVDSDYIEAHCTFEFENVITDASGNASVTTWSSSYNYNFYDSALNTFLNGTEQSNDGSVLEMLPTDLQNKIQTVTKKVATSTDSGSTYNVTTYTTKLFPLSYREITASGSSSDQKDEGSTYAFYTGTTGDTDANRIKKKVDGIGGVYYWLRSPNASYSSYAWYVLDYVSFDCVYDYAYAVAPAFCI